jgi:hypothetical protein
LKLRKYRRLVEGFAICKINIRVQLKQVFSVLCALVTSNNFVSGQSTLSVDDKNHNFSLNVNAMVDY